MARTKPRAKSSSKSKVNVLLIVFVFILIAWLIYATYFANTGRSLLLQTNTILAVESQDSIALEQTINNMPNSSSSVDSLQIGVVSSAGVLKTVRVDKQTYQENLTINGRVVPNLVSYAPIELLSKQNVQKHQIFLITISLGGNECDSAYKIIDIVGKHYSVTDSFASCTEYKSATISGNKFTTNFVKINSSSIYSYDIITKILSENSVTTNRTIEVNTAKQIINMANKDGCAKGDLIYMDKSCDDGNKYCRLFRQLPKDSKKDSYYKALNNFCN